MSTNKADYSIGSPATNGGESTSSEKTAEEWKFAAVRLEKLQLVNGNDRCADCGKVEPKWASWNLGVLICYECAGMHRCVLGGYNSKLRSLEGLTPWTEEEVANLEQIGNIKANARYEAFLPEAFERPRHNEALMKSFIKDKYELRKYMSANMSDFIGIPPKQGGESSSSEKGSCCNVL